MSNSLWSQGLQPTRLLCPWNFPGKSSGVGCHFLLQGIFPIQGWNPHLQHWQWILYHRTTWENLNYQHRQLNAGVSSCIEVVRGKTCTIIYSSSSLRLFSLHKAKENLHIHLSRCKGYHLIQVQLPVCTDLYWFYAFFFHKCQKLFLINSIAFLGEGNGTPLQYSCRENPMDWGAWWASDHGVAKSRTRLSDFTFTSHFHALEKEMATHSSVLACRIPGTGEPGGLPSMGSHRVGHEWSDLAAAAAALLFSDSIKFY